MRALQTCIGAELATGRHDDVIGELHGLTERRPLQEPFWEHLLLALYRATRPGEALAAYERLRRTLADELGTSPARRLQQLHRQMLEQDPALEYSTAPVGSAVTAMRVAEPGVRSVAVLPFEVIGESRAAPSRHRPRRHPHDPVDRGHVHVAATAARSCPLLVKLWAET